MAKHYVSKTCDCGNEISWIDDITPGFRQKEEEVIVCQNCKRKHNVAYSGNFYGLKGAVVESEIQTVDCPICKLSPEDVRKMTEKEADDIVLRREGTAPWCSRHTIQYLTVRKASGLIGKCLLEEMVRP